MNKANINEKNNYGQNVLHYTVENRVLNYEVLNTLVKNGININDTDNYGQVPSYYAIQSENITHLKLLARYKSDLSVKDNYGETLLHHAIKRNSLDVVQYLLQKIDYRIKNHSGHTPFHCTARQNQIVYFKLLLEKGADVNEVDNEGNSILMLAIDNLAYDFVNLLLAMKVDVNHSNKYQRTALHEAAESKQRYIVRKLLNAGAIKNKKERWGDTPYSIALKDDDIVLQQMLK